MPTYTYRCLSCASVCEATHGVNESPIVPCPGCGGLTRRTILVAPTVVKRGNGPADTQQADDAHQCGATCALHYPREHWTQDPSSPSANPPG